MLDFMKSLMKDEKKQKEASANPKEPDELKKALGLIQGVLKQMDVNDGY